MSRNRAYSNGTVSSGHGSEGRNPSANNTPRRKQQNHRHDDHHTNGEHHHQHEMTLICHRVDLFDDFVPGGGPANGGERTVAIGQTRCLGVDRGCECHTPCTFCHTVIIEHDAETMTSYNGVAASAGGESDATSTEIHPNLAFLFAGNPAARTHPAIAEREVEENDTKATTVSSSLELEPIFAQNHGLFCDNGHGGLRVKRYHHPPVGKYKFTPPLIELSKFFDTSNSKQSSHTHSNFICRSEPTQENGTGLDSFFDNFSIIDKPNTQQKSTNMQGNENDDRILVFRAPLKTVVKNITSSRTSQKCLCEQRYKNEGYWSMQPNPHDPTVVHDKYWAQKRRLFKKFDEGIQLDGEGWYSVTPEVVADHVASRFADAFDQLMSCQDGNTTVRGSPCTNRRRGGRKQKPKMPMVILDAFCGCGGNAIAFGKLPSSVVSLIVCIDVDRTKLRMAANNASVYRIHPSRIVFVEANSVAVMERCYRDGKLIMDPPPRTPVALGAYPPREIYDGFTIGGIDLLTECASHIDAVFMDPPWGGIDYGAMGKDGYDLARDMKIRGCERGCVGFPPTPEVDGVRLLKIAAAATSTRFVAYDLPRNANKKSLALAALEAGYEGNSKLEEHYINGRLKTVTGYFGQDFRHILDLNKYCEGT